MVELATRKSVPREIKGQSYHQKQLAIQEKQKRSGPEGEE